ncbi:SDR family NAD(P)-dependent oxidoreductase [Chryseobacterium arthrosphaerae]|uniref:SDR family NAD(P)-dependent oxidoreductase n=1 Tax=Chryseobacterium arthrosphaerae TaxID=651561 RepID=UPI0023E20A73|nr:SDR family NAD(P)-dependent oxidoreductase [Chryseobacterium arthrosphaerae]WES98175.1 SDR family NAD(P)-dependent oxidoreductase [Chryseobacterium arthrosphaerae]
MQNNENKVALVSGANTGVGFQIAKALVEDGYVVYVGSRDLQKGEAAVEQLGGLTKAIQLDVTDSESIRAAVEIVEKEHRYLTLLVNNAAVSHAGTPGRTLEEIMGAQRASIASISELKKVWDTNVFGTLALTQAFLPLLHKAQGARIVTVSSALGSLTINANPENPYRSNFDAVYGASKTALNGIFLSLAIELENSGIKVHLVSPGFTATALNNFQGTDSVEEGSKEPIRVALSEDLPTGSFTGPADFSEKDNILPW